MTYEIKLKTGFFKTEEYILDVSKTQTTLTPKDKLETSNIVIEASELISLTITKGKNYLTEFEIHSRDCTYTGIIDRRYSFDQLIYDFTKELGDKFIFQ